MMRVYRLADIGFDHYLVQVNLKFKFGFALDLQNQVEILADIPDVEDSWMAMKTDGERLKYDGSKTATWQLIDDR